MRYMSRAARMARHHKRHKGEALINLVSMIDMLTILLFFLLVYSNEEVEVLPSARDVQLPESIAEEHAREAAVVIVTDKEILINGESVGLIEEIMASDSVIIPALQTALEHQVERVLVEEGGEPLSEEEQIANREVTIMADKEIPYELLKKVMATSTAADYGSLSLAVLQVAADFELASVARN